MRTKSVRGYEKGGNRQLRSVVVQVDVLEDDLKRKFDVLPPSVLPGPVEHRWT